MILLYAKREPVPAPSFLLVKYAVSLGAYNFLSVKAPKSQEYCMYFKILGQRQAENMPPRCARGFNQSFLNLDKLRWPLQSSASCSRRIRRDSI